MGNITLKQEKNHSSKKGNKLDSKKIESDNSFVLSDVSKEELNKRRIPVYSYLL